MWSLETLAQINQKHAELGRDGPVDHREVYAECGIRLLGDTQKLPVTAPPSISDALFAAFDGDSPKAQEAARLVGEFTRARMGLPPSPPDPRPDEHLVQFFAYETVGATIPHTESVLQTDDPALMKALGEAIESGRVVMDGDTIVSIDGKPV